MRFRDLPIRRKLMLAIVLSSAVALLVGGGAMIFFEFVRSRHLLVRELSTETEIIAANSAAAVAFQDKRAAWETLAALQNHPAIVQACLFTADGKLFVDYKSDKVPADFPALDPESPGHRLDQNYLLVFRPVTLYGDVVGSISLRSDLYEESARLKASMSIAVVALLTALFVSLLLSIRFQKIISKPVLELAGVAHEVMKRKDYSLRATKESDDEIGQLIEAFNQMLGRIEKRDAALGASEERFRQLAENISEVFWITDLTKEEIIYISPAYETVWGRTCESVYQSPQTWIEAIHADDRERVVSAARTKQEKGEYDEVYRIERPDGSLRWIHDRAFPVRDGNGKIYRLAGIAEDITKRKQVEEALNQVEANYRSIFENAIDGIFQTSPEGRYLAANPAMARMLGYDSPEELVANISNLGDEICVEPQSRLELRDRLMRDGQVQEFENQLYRKDRSKIWISLNARAVRNERGEILYYEGSTKDITERKRAEETLRRTEQIYREAITGAGAVPYICDYKTRSYRFIGDGIERLTGYAPHELSPAFWKKIGKESVMLGELAGLSLEEAIRRVSSGEVHTWRCDMRIITRDGQSRWISDVSVQNHDESGRLVGAMGILQDVTERKLAEKKSAAFSSLASQLSAAATPEEASAYILETAAELIGWDCGFVRLYDREHDHIVPILTLDLVDGKRTSIPSSNFQGPSPLMRFIMKNGALLVDPQKRASMPLEFVPFGNKTCISTSMMYVPIRQAGNAIGVVSVQRYTPNVYCQQDLDLLQALADHGSGALQRIQITEQLREAEAKYRSIFEGATEGIFQSTPDGRYLNANPALARMFGYESSEQMLASVTDIESQTYVLPEKRREWKRLLESQDSVHGFEVERFRKDGSKFWISINVRAVRDADRVIRYYEGTIRDITSRRYLEKQLIEISDREQSRMGQDLHDGLCQQLVRTAIAANLLEKDLAAQSSAQIEQAKKVCQLVDDAITEARNLARGLYPVKLEIEGLHSALEELAANIRSAYNLDCEFDACDSICISDHALATHLYRIAQEGATNAAKHARPKQIRIRLENIANKIHLSVSDDGTGIPATALRADSMGLHIMNYRAGLIGAALKVEPLPEGGTIVSCIFEHRNGIEQTGKQIDEQRK